jgi:type I restriction enzyme S subunit
LLEQQQVANQIKMFDEEVKRLESICQRKLAALDELKQSLLHQAFAGEL